jgi:hypothetical protein
MERLVELRGRCRRQTSSLVMFYRYQQSLIDEAATTLGALLQRSFYFAPRPHHVVIAADQSGQIPARVLRLSHSAKKIEALGRGDRRYGIAFGGMRSGVGGARHYPSNIRFESASPS